MNVHINPRQWNNATPPDYTAVYAWRQRQLLAMRASPINKETSKRVLVEGALEYYRTRPAEFIAHWCDTFDPRNAADPDMLTTMPMVLFPRQVDLVDFLHALVLGKANGLIEKCRDMGATWVCVAFSVWLWIYLPGSAIGWGSRKSELVDKLGDPKSIFEKIRQCIRGLPREFLPAGFDADKHMTSMRVLNPANQSTIIGEIGDEIGRGGRTLIYFKDESAHYEHPELVEAALGQNTNVQVDISSVNGLGNVFHRKRKAGVVWARGNAMVRNRANIFIMDWSENPLHTQEWFDNQKESKESEGLGHIFAQEVLRDYAGSVTGVIIPQKFVLACVDAHKIIPGMLEGKWVAALDPADPTDGGGDGHAAGARKGVVLSYSEHWFDGDAGAATRRTVGKLRTLSPSMEVEYDSVGVGAAVTAEVNRLKALPEGDPEKMPRGLKWVAWNAGGKVLNPDDPIIEPVGAPDAERIALNKDQYANLKAQAWWAMRTRCEKTMKAIEAVKAGQPCPYPVDHLCSFDSSQIKPEILAQLENELSQPVRKKDIVSTKLTVDKKPPGTKSPNLADKTVMLFFPIPPEGYDLAAAL
jgi:phage terminase large subunit